MTFHEGVSRSILSDADEFAFAVAYAAIFIDLAFMVQLAAWAYTWHDRWMGKMTTMGSKNPPETDIMETIYGPSAKLPSEPVTEQFLKKSAANPGRIALVVKGKESAERSELTYESLATKVRNLSKKLYSSGVFNGQIVALALDRGVHQIATIYATMLCGAAWVPVDPAVPEFRLKELLQDVNPSLILHQADATGLQVALWSEDLGVRTAISLLDASDLQVKTMSFASQSMPTRKGTLNNEKNKMDDCALVIYTSGTTGKPKGIMYSHAMINHGANAVAALMEMSWESVAFLKTPFIWAVVEWELFPALIRGGTLVVGSAQVHKEPQSMADAIQAERVTSLVMAPDVLDLLLDVHEQGSQLQSLKHVISVGAALPVALANRFAKMSRMTARLHNVYGASESSCAVWTVPPNGVPGLWSERTPVGLPQMGCCVWVLDEDLRKVPTGDVGELCFGGQLASGYFNMPELTAQKFIVHPEFGQIYRTGDLARWHAGVLEVCGRRDRQVKISGVRVEPEEVESALRAFVPPRETAPPSAETHLKPLMHVACVATTGFSPELVAFVSPTISDAHMKILREHLVSKLPRYYLPKHMFCRDFLPVLPNGKINLKMLVEDADRSVEMSSAETVLDSFGQMRSMSKGMILENQVTLRCYTFWMLGVQLDHFYNCGADHIPGYYGCVAISTELAGKYVVEPWVNMAIAQVGNFQCMYGFILLGALQKSRPKAGEVAVHLKLGYEDAFCYLTFLLMGLHPPTGVVHLHRWYLFMVVYSHLCIAIGQRLRMPGWLQASVLIAWTLFPFDACSCNIPEWFADFLRWILPLQQTYNEPSACSWPGLTTHVFTVMYILSFYYVRELRNWVTGTIARMGCNTAAWAVVALGTSMLVGVLNLVIGRGGLLYVVCLMLQPSLLALAMTWLPIDMSWWGNAALSTYILHPYFGGYLKRSIWPGLLQWAHDKPGVLQLVVLLVVPIAFMSIAGPAFQYCLVVPTAKWLGRVAEWLKPKYLGDAPCGNTLTKGVKN